MSIAMRAARPSGPAAVLGGACLARAAVQAP
jgi:hypothetical protein